nr:reverse transcriptase domain-containing protein [Tanacetum cinerariifolium]
MSTNEQTLLSQPTSTVRNTLGKEQAPQNLVRPVSDEDLREYCDKNYHQILPIIVEKLHQEKAKLEKLKAVKARLNFEEASPYSESETPNRKRNLKERLGSRYARTRSGSPKPRLDRSKSPRKKDLEKRTVFKRLEKGEFHRLGDKEKNVSSHSRGSERKSYYSSRRDTKSCYQSSRSKETKTAFEKHRHKREYSRRTEAVSESPDKVKFLIMAMDYFTKWIESRPLATITGTQVKNVPAEIGMPALRTVKVGMVKNNEALGISLDLLEEKIEQATIHEARNKAKMERYYNAKVRSTSFRPGDIVYRSNEASHAKGGGKLVPMWEGPYEVTEALGKGAYRLRDRNGHPLP